MNPIPALFCFDAASGVYSLATEDTVIEAAALIQERRLRRLGVITDPAAAVAFLRAKIGGLPYEAFHVIYLDAQHGIIAFETLFRGTLTQTSVYPREIARNALLNNAAALIVSHNHPSGNVSASAADKTLTTALQSALGLLDVRLLDHFIVTPSDSFSFAQNGLL